jgi:ABC-2 type transport system ATP-binding protein
MIAVSHLHKRFGRRRALDDLSFEVARGEIVGFLGPNGAGKTTTMRILSCFFPATSGRVAVAGFDTLSQSIEVRKRIGYLPENFPIYADMRVEEYLRYRGALKGVTGRRLRLRVRAVLEQCGLMEERRAVAGTLSRGYRQRVGLADSLLHEPDLLILDEPTIGLDPRQNRQIRDVIARLADRHTVLLSSHILPEVEEICRRVIIIDKGRIVADDTPARLADRMLGGQRLVAEIEAPRQEVRTALEALEGAVSVAAEPCAADETWCRVVCDCRPQSDLRDVLSALAARKQWRLRELRVERKNLEDVFVAITGQGNADVAAEKREGDHA